MQRILSMCILLCCAGYDGQAQAGPASRAHMVLGRYYHQYVSPYVDAAWNMSCTPEQAIIATLGIGLSGICMYKSHRLFVAGLGASASLLGFHALYHGGTDYAASKRSPQCVQNRDALSCCLQAFADTIEKDHSQQGLPDHMASFSNTCRELASHIQQGSVDAVQSLSKDGYETVKRYVNQAWQLLRPYAHQDDDQSSVDSAITQSEQMLRDMLQRIETVQQHEDKQSQEDDEDTEARSYVAWAVASGLTGACAGYGICQLVTDAYTAYAS